KIGAGSIIRLPENGAKRSFCVAKTERSGVLWIKQDNMSKNISFLPSYQPILKILSKKAVKLSKFG
ncbi:MAG: hypothetical protein E6959_11560, partial [Eikenella corrodens]|nr:hypothetical protein [Eikenella corrodens]